MTQRVLGIETEYGILAAAAPELHPAVLSAAVVAAYPGIATGTTLEWDDPIPIEDAHNRVLANGARLYVDHAHPEYSGPEVTTAIDALAYDLAGDAAVVAAARAASAQLGVEIGIYKNNTDSRGASYGCHENHLLPRSLPWDRIRAAVPSFLVSRAVLVGAGRVGLGQHGELAGFQLTQRADFFETVEGIQTTRRRPILNTRDEPHARPASYRRLHVITGDANRSQFTTWLKAGTLAAFLTALQAGALPVIELADPVAAFTAVSHDPGLTALLQLADGRRLSALDLQEVICDAVRAEAQRHPEDYETEVLTAWAEVLADLRRDPESCADRLDWVAKLQLLRAYADRDQLAWDHPRLAQLDLVWARLDRPGPVEALERAGRLRTLVAPERVARAGDEPPADTRAWLRGTLVRLAADRVVGASWDWMSVRDSNGGLHRLDLAEPAGSTSAAVGAIRDAAAVDALLRRLG
ncbi:MAG: proteasome accessory factor PafA2 family protein [Propionibacteriaceae bacterium]|nr:proteasome accessory factor PafA2 family protein [Propionibacteriaceae bacterium]